MTDKIIGGIPETELDEAKAKMREIKVNAFDMLRHFAVNNYDPKTSGYKDLEDAFIKITKRAEDECEKIIVALERKYPR